MGDDFTHVSFRFTKADVERLDFIVDWERQKGPVMFPSALANRTTVLKALIERERIRLLEEAAHVADTLKRAKRFQSELDEPRPIGEETPGQRKTRLQRERRARKRVKVA